LIAAFFGNTVFAQNTFRAIIKDADTKEVLIGASAVMKK
jgi:iron complex outermembrane receptor protein